MSLCLAFSLLAVDSNPAEERQQIGSRLRCLDAEAGAVLADASAWSPSVRRLIERIERSDLIVYLRMDGLLVKHRGETRLITAAPGARYVMVGLSPRGDERELAAMLGHELQHVTEIADAPNVRDVKAMLDLFKRIGWPGTSANGYETDEAIEVGRQVAREVRTVFSQARAVTRGETPSSAAR